MAWNSTEEYFSGQGDLLVGLRTATGKPMGLRHVGNVPELTLTVTQEEEGHKESKTGLHSTDFTMVKSTEVSMSATLEKFSTENIAMLLRSKVHKVDEGSVVDETIYAMAGHISPLDHLFVSNVVVKNGSKTLVAYVDDNTPYDYEVNEQAGSIKFNADSLNLGLPITSITTGATTALTIDNAPVSVGDLVTLNGFTGADATSVNRKSVKVMSVTDTQIVVALDTSSKDLTATNGVVYYDGMPVTVSYSHGAFDEVQALTTGKVMTYWRFEGLNTASENGEFKPVVVDIFKVSSQPLQELSLISDSVQSVKLDSQVLADTERAKTQGINVKSKSAFFSVRKAPSPDNV